jgi:phosphoserine aminotransferase
MSKEKSQLLYDLIDNSNWFCRNPVDKSSRSRMNVVFLLSNTDIETKFLEGSRAANWFELKGHRSVGGFRAALYNGIKLDDFKRLANFMTGLRWISARYCHGS